ncbi:MAG TPA: 3-deoxy-manno-octulosonate cytidylyltransferase [Longimicrobiales bacterium]|nr:3-deoxy-manno-octulosonate cytidylyltransferase [Longimicrobiales bacterium]
MAAPRVLGVVPARLASERLPRKPLQELGGRPLIERVWRRAAGMPVFERVVVATDSDEVAAVCRAAGASVELTSTEHASGTERVAEVATRSSYRGFDVVVNLQGDEPFVAEEALAGAARLAASGWDVGTAATPLRSAGEWRSPDVVKVVRRDDAGALYFSRAPIPWRRGSEPDAEAFAGPWYLRHVGVYAYTPEALGRWVALPPHPLEAEERLEQLRPLAAGLRIGVAVVAAAERGVDTPEDLAWAEARLRVLEASSP